MSIFIISKNGEIKESVKKGELYKIAGLKSEEGFKCHTIWNVENHSISVYGKINGKAGQENKYEFPPPLDNILFFGNVLLVSKEKISLSDWEEIYEYLYGNFEELESEDESEDESVEKTKEGYEKDGFVVDEKEMYLECSSELSEEEYI